jgi:hypothetical protein
MYIHAFSLFKSLSHTICTYVTLVLLIHIRRTRCCADSAHVDIQFEGVREATHVLENYHRHKGKYVQTAPPPRDRTKGPQGALDKQHERMEKKWVFQRSKSRKLCGFVLISAGRDGIANQIHYPLNSPFARRRLVGGAPSRFLLKWLLKDPLLHTNTDITVSSI